MVHAPGNDLFVETGTDNELGTRFDCFLAFFKSQNGAGANKHVRAAGGDILDRLDAGCGAHGNFHDIETGVQQCLRSGHGIIRIIDHNHRHQAG